MAEVTYTVWSLDVWGHAPSECIDYKCPCVYENPDASEGHAYEHDEMRCQCGFDVNDRCRVGTIDLPYETEADDLNLLRALQAGGFAKDSLTLTDVEFDDPSCDGESIYVQDARTGEPIFQLELQDECRKCGALLHAGECS